ncbi:MAG: hypothetical protein QXN26_05125 [Thermoplasmataceae archaeon]
MRKSRQMKMYSVKQRIRICSLPRLSKDGLPEDVIEDMKEPYSRLLKFLETERKGMWEEEMNDQKNDFKRMTLILAEYNNEEIDKEKMLELSSEIWRRE